MTLANDITRCNDAACHLRETCARWVERVPTIEQWQQATFRRGLLPCCSFIPIRTPEPDPAQGDMFGGGEC